MILFWSTGIEFGTWPKTAEGVKSEPFVLLLARGHYLSNNKKEVLVGVMSFGEMAKWEPSGKFRGSTLFPAPQHPHLPFDT